MLDLQEIVTRLQTENINNVSMATHINYQQIWRIKAKADKNPTYKILKSLSDFLEEQNK